jgi:hypothetical protein
MASETVTMMMVIRLKAAARSRSTYTVSETSRAIREG